MYTQCPFCASMYWQAEIKIMECKETFWSISKGCEFESCLERTIFLFWFQMKKEST